MGLDVQTRFGRNIDTAVKDANSRFWAKDLPGVVDEVFASEALYPLRSLVVEGICGRIKDGMPWETFRELMAKYGEFTVAVFEKCWACTERPNGTRKRTQEVMTARFGYKGHGDRLLCPNTYCRKMMTKTALRGMRRPGPVKAGEEVACVYCKVQFIIEE